MQQTKTTLGPVKVCTGGNGLYVGTILEGCYPVAQRILVLGILKPAQHWDGAALVRRGFRVGEIIDLTQQAKSSVWLTQETGFAEYAAALCAELSRRLGYHAAGTLDDWRVRRECEVLRAALLAEARYVATGAWGFNLDGELNAE